MSTRISLRSGDTLWTAKVDGSAVTVARDERASSTVAPAGDAASSRAESTFQVAQASDVWTVDATANRVTGVAVRDHDRVWVMLDGELFDFLIEERGARTRGAGRDQGALMPPMPATVLRVNVTPGQTVADGDVLIVLEAMKMELSIRAPRNGVVTAVYCAEGDLVQPETTLVDFT